MKRSIIILLKIFVVLTLLAQNEDVARSRDPENYFRSPEVADIMRFGNTPVSQNAGRFNLSVPLAEIKDQDFELQISVNYNSSGFMPMKAEGSVGLNWSLSGAGVISREVKGISDDEEIYDNQDVRGFMYFLKNKGKYNQTDIITNHTKYIPTSFLALPYPIFTDNTQYPNIDIEANSDIYHFNFGRHSGKFMINFDGSVSVSSESGGKYKILLDEYTYAQFNSNYYSTIKIITDDGYTYSFGGSYDNMEYSLSWSHRMNGLLQHDGFFDLLENHEFKPSISSFYLYKIEAPNGRVLNIKYKPLSTEYHAKHNWQRLLPSSEATQYKMNYLSSFSWDASSSLSASANYPNSVSTNINHTLTKVALIDVIFTDNQLIRFHYSPINSRIPVREEHFFELEKQAGAKLDSVSTYYTDNGAQVEKINTASLSYHSTNEQYSRYFLSGIKLSKTGIYNFYYNLGTLPSPLTKNIDYWNYWRGTPVEEGDLIPKAKSINATSIEYETNRREPTDKDFDLAMLSRVVYPTGGCSYFKYEQHTYNKIISRTSASSYYPALLSIGNPEKAGGVRIQKIINTPNVYLSNNGEVVRYIYKDSFKAKQSSGILNYKPIYHQRIDYLGSGYLGQGGYYKVEAPFYYTTSAGFNLRAYENDHVTYSSVIEARYDIKHDNDSITNLSISPLDPVRIRHINDIIIDDIYSQTWDITGKGYKNGAKANLFIRGPVTKKIVFDKEERESYVETPASLGLTTGRYSIYVMTDSMASIALEIRYDNTDLTKIPLKEYTISKYTDHSNWPDLNPLSVYGKLPDNASDYTKNSKIEFIDRSRMRGQILSEKMYNANHQLLRQAEYTYNLSENEQKSYTFNKLIDLTTVIYNGGAPVYGKAYGAYFQMRPIEFSTSQMAGRNTREFVYASDKDSIPKEIVENNELYHYNKGYLKNKSSIGSDQKKMYTTYVYSFEKQGAPYERMSYLNILSPIVETEQLKGNTIISVTRNNYSLVENTQNLPNRLPVITSVETGKKREHREVRVEYLKHDKYGNPIHLRKDNATNIVYLWGHEGQYPVAQIVSATYADVEIALGEKPENISMTGHTKMEKINNLRAKLPDAQISTYIYKPFVGLISTTDSSGMTIYYSYDNAGRLTESYRIEKGKKVIMQNQEYKYVQE
ncbi:RHS repeat protein [Dysgonomonas sp. 25]|uniref:RHS repeat protein n=1 Tax=Dysgonomonas sp. 25 TaxID=2302933 RepID=UPI0013D84A2D|nr:RHS repeat protein [Dysgonomonas sp. 25]NDV69680.1 hypothetical protein [Dysgonomonas sp. 25]